MLSSSSTEKVYALAIGAHPDDVELTCGATLLKIMQEGASVAVCDLTRGEMATLGTPEIRRQEALLAKEAMGYRERVSLDLGDGQLRDNEENMLAIITIIRRFTPQVVFVHAPDERHPDHMKASRLVSDALFYAGLCRIQTAHKGHLQQPYRPAHLLYYIQHRHVDADIIVDVSSTFEASRKGIQAFSTQFWNPEDRDKPATILKRREFLESLEARARYFGEQIGTRYGEGFICRSTPAIGNFTALFPQP